MRPGPIYMELGRWSGRNLEQALLYPTSFAKTPLTADAKTRGTMYCNHCGSPVAVDQLVCSQCGRSPAEGRAAIVARSRVPEHLHLLAIFWYVVGSVMLIPTLILVVLVGVARSLYAGDLPPWVTVAAPALFLMIAIFVSGIAVASLLTGWGLQKVRPWGRTLALVMAFIALVHPPFGTALGIYTLYVLLSPDAGAEYDRLAKAEAARATSA